MPRKARINYPGGVFHVISRFARDEWCLKRTGARAQYLSLLGRAAAGTDTQVLAYCLMSSHIHLVLMQQREPLSRILKSMNTGFAIWVSRTGSSKHAHGPVFAGRPRQVLVEREAYLDVLVRYVHNNPVRANVVPDARDSDWSSHRAYIGEGTRPDWLHTDMVLSGYGKRASTQARRFDEFVHAGSDEGRRPEFSGDDDADARRRMREVFGDGHRLSDGVIGSDEFVASVRSDDGAPVRPLERGRPFPRSVRQRPTIDELISATLLVRGVEPWEFDNRPRAHSCAVAKRIITWIWVHEFHGAQIEVARALKISTSAVAQHYATCMKQAADYDELSTAVLGTLDARIATTTDDRSAATKARYHVDTQD
ncbi:MAG: hypothetical protein GXP55_06300 [Deltaproteobacteria bacterium]|nr:hypothetical protein [Deltaproteobacteria bacterium]